MSNQETTGELWEVFLQAKPGLAFKHAGSVHGSDAEIALQNARDVYTRRNEAVGLWIVPSDQIIAAAPADEQAFFDPADDKIYRHPTFYNVPEGVKHM